jgi:rhamnose transport system ATP-binding protein
MDPEVSALEFRDIHKSFGAVQALRGVSFDVAAGSAHACVGENGAGKSTLLKILAGIVRPDAGEVRLDGRPVHCATPRDALAHGIGIVFQERTAFPNLSVTANVFAGRELTTAGGRLDEAAMRAVAQRVLTDLHAGLSPDARMEHVSAAHAQLVQIARALAFDCRVLVLDEPTTSLTDAEVEHLFRILRVLQSRGVTLLFVSHRLPEVFRLCDAITVLRDGRHVGTFRAAETTPDAIVRAMVGREPPPRVARATAAAGGRVALELRHFTRRPWFEDVSLSVRAREIVALFGLVGSGRTELLETIFGLAAASRGQLLIDGEARVLRTSEAAVRAGVGLVPEDRQRQGLFFNLHVLDNLMLPRAQKAGVRRIDRRGEADGAQAMAATLGMPAQAIARAPETLSGGNQQKVVAGKWLATSPRLLLLDEPTKGVDVGARFEIHRLIRERADDGMACLVVSSDLPEVLALADRIVVLRQGRVRGELNGSQATEEDVMRLAAHDATVPA